MGQLGPAANPIVCTLPHTFPLFSPPGSSRSRMWPRGASGGSCQYQSAARCVGRDPIHGRGSAGPRPKHCAAGDIPPRIPSSTSPPLPTNLSPIPVGRFGSTQVRCVRSRTSISPSSPRESSRCVLGGGQLVRVYRGMGEAGGGALVSIPNRGSLRSLFGRWPLPQRDPLPTPSFQLTFTSRMQCSCATTWALGLHCGSP